ncbi:MAG: hypothetical protein RR594_05955 [Clostridia bacterium]
MKNKDYEVTFEQEVLSEVCEGILADLLKVLIKKNISTKDKKNPLCLLYLHLAKTKNDIIGSKYSTLESLKKVEGYFTHIKEYIDQLDNM